MKSSLRSLAIALSLCVLPLSCGKVESEPSGDGDDGPHRGGDGDGDGKVSGDGDGDILGDGDGDMGTGGTPVEGDVCEIGVLPCQGEDGCAGTTTCTPQGRWGACICMAEGAGGIASNGGAAMGGDGGTPVPAKCGDGVVHPPEQCDAGASDTAGCSADCRLEWGFQCSGQPSVCTETICGDGLQQGTEACDEGVLSPEDACSDECRLEPECSAPGDCTQVCGDGVITAPEVCDDHNLVDGDGCSSTCDEEPGYLCAHVDVDQPSECSPICGDGIVGLGEECDFGSELNFGGYNGCNVDCTLGGYCGDGLVQEEFEFCDDRAPGESRCGGCRALGLR